MYTISKNSQITLALLKAHNIRHIIINPGTTNMPITRGVQNDPFFTCYSVVDERSTMYFAIGLYLNLGVPIATTCTSAQATRNYIPGLTEAYYKHVPILAITTSKHPKYTGQEYLQGPDQTSLPIDAVKKSFALPYINSNIDELHCIRLANEAMLELTHRTPGPVQLNIHMLDSEADKYTLPELPNPRVIKRYMLWDEWEISLENKKVMVVVGEHRPFSKKQIDALDSFLDTHNAFVYVNHLSNYHGVYAVSANLAISCMDNKEFTSTYRPDILITIGGQTGDYPIFGKLSAGTENDFEHWRISESGDIVDTYDKLTKVFECPFDLFFSRLIGKDTVSHTYFQDWEKLNKSISIPDELPLSNAYLAQQLHSHIPKHSFLNLAILNSLRNWSFFPLDPTIKCYSNVGAFGIDGCMSVLLGESVASENICFMVIGDLSFFYDMNSLGIRHLKNNIRILLINNNCGAEFKLYSHPAHQFGKEGDLFIAAAGHNSNAKGWVEANEFKYLSANNKDEFLKTKDEFLKESDKPIVFEIFTTHEDESLALKTIINHNKKVTLQRTIKDKIKPFIGERGVEFIKKIIR